MKEIDTLDGSVYFVKLDKNADWLLKILRGKAEKGALRRSSLFNTFARMLQHDSPWTPERGAGRSPSSAVADMSSPAVAESQPCDPMSQLQDISSDVSTPEKARKGGYVSKRGQNNIQIATMPEYELVSHPGRAEERRMRSLPTSTNSMWLCIDDIPWLVRWLSDELRSGGVPLEASEPVDAPTCNCVVEDLHIRWDFGGAWEAIIFQGARRARYSSAASRTSQKRSGISLELVRGTALTSRSPAPLGRMGGELNVPGGTHERCHGPARAGMRSFSAPY